MFRRNPGTEVPNIKLDFAALNRTDLDFFIACGILQSIVDEVREYLMDGVLICHHFDVCVLRNFNGYSPVSGELAEMQPARLAAILGKRPGLPAVGLRQIPPVPTSSRSSVKAAHALRIAADDFQKFAGFRIQGFIDQRFGVSQ